MVARILLVLTIGALVYGGCTMLSGYSPIPPVDPTEAVIWSASRTSDAGTSIVEGARQAAQKLESQGTQEANRANGEQGTRQALANERERLAAEGTRLAVEQNAIDATAQARQERGTRQAQARQETAQATRQLATIAVQQTAAERSWIAQGWTATADQALAQAKATGDQAASWRQETADAAAVQALQTAQAAQALVSQERAEQERINTEILEMRKTANAWAPYVGGAALAVALAAGFVYWQRHRVIKRDANGQAPIVQSGNKLMDLDRSVLPVLDPNQPIQADRDAHLRITENAQKVQALRQLQQGKGSPAQALGLLKSAPAAAAPTNGNGGQVHQPAPWSVFVRENGMIPLGVGPNGNPQLPDLDEWPHRLYAGKTGSGKSRFGLRPHIAGALGRGWSVVVIGDRAPVDFKVFEARPNFYSLLLDDPAHVLPYLAAINREITARWALLYKAGASTWSRLDHAGPRVVIVFDEFAALLDDIDGREKSEFVHQVTNISRLARKAGVHLIVGVQNPTADNIRPSIKRNMLSVAYQVSDSVASRVILDADGAEKLVPPQYLARMVDLWRGVGFDPDDAQISDYLDSRHVPAYDPPSFLAALPEPGERELLPFGLPKESAPDPEIERLAGRIRPAWRAGATKRAMAKLAGKEYAGAFCAKLDAAIASLEKQDSPAAATTTTLIPPSPASRPA